VTTTFPPWTSSIAAPVRATALRSVTFDGPST
jgi:hypothetical protein